MVARRTKITSLSILKDWIEEHFPNRFNMKTFDTWVERGYGEDGWWHLREQLRCERSLVPSWITRHEGALRGPPISHFFVRVSSVDPNKIIYTPSPVDGMRDVQVLTSVGKFLTAKYASQLSASQIKHIADEHRSTYSDRDVCFSFDAEEIQEVYENGPGSCMVGKNWYFEHPVRVYDGPDIAIAYLKNGKKIVARTMINLKTTPMQFTRIYGDATVLTARLLQLGFVLGNLSGCRLRKEKVSDGRFICPYIDFVPRVDWKTNPDFLIANNRSGAGCQSTEGCIVVA
jgi:hypothetical protein